LPGFLLFLQSAGIALFVLDFWYFSSGKSTERKEMWLIFSFPFVLIQKEQKIKPARFPHPLCQLAKNTIRVVPHQCPAHKAISFIDEANVPPSSDAPDVFSSKPTFTATAASTRRPPTAQLISNWSSTFLLSDIDGVVTGWEKCVSLQIKVNPSWVGCAGRHEQRAGGWVNAKTAGIRQSRPPRAGMFVWHNTTKNFIFLESLFVLCYTLFAWISAVFAECVDSVVRAGFLVLFIREKYGKKTLVFDHGTSKNVQTYCQAKGLRESKDAKV
jgi:hypothetical protein